MGLRSLRVPQTIETCATRLTRDRYTLDYAYLRAPDAQPLDEPGQDFLHVVEDGVRIVFALCDGVSQSFFGDVGARILGDALVEWLWEPAGIETWLEPRLRDLRCAAAEHVGTIALPAGLSPLVEGVLEGKRAQGTESMFVAGSIDLDGDALTLAWMGDSRLRLWDADGRESTVVTSNGQVDSTQRWSSRRGPVGQPRIVTTTLEDIGRLVAYSDGLAELDHGPIAFASTDQLDTAVTRCGLASGDDACILIVDLLHDGV
ncbi:MAG TPA: protein phosphatase 2C domain-containing protein [Chloroflexota bacterium]|jgi:hypothetical protein